MVRWWTPARPAWMDEETYNRLPGEITVREPASRVTIPSFRPDEIILVTTMTEFRYYTKHDIFQACRGRWNAEIDFRSIKVHMSMEDLRGQSPEIVRKELWVHCLAYNLIRKTMAQAAVMHDQTVRTISFAGALQGVAGMMMQSAAVNHNLFLDVAENKLESIVSRQVGHPSNRVEPQAIKRRPKPRRFMTKPRGEARREFETITKPGRCPVIQGALEARARFC